LARDIENSAFVCAHCGGRVPPLSNGSYRNHCPFCLWSKHVDDQRPGDRASACLGPMAPVAVARSKKGWQIVHRCERCGVDRRNRIADATEAPDDIGRIVELMRACGPQP
jgi:hypothetical protein